MIRTVISLDPDDKAWLDEAAQREGVPMTEMIRRAVRRMRAEDRKLSFGEILKRTRGTWKHGDGLEYQIRMREEWDRE